MSPKISPAHSTKLKTALIGLAIVIIGAVAGWFAQRARQMEMLGALIVDARQFAAAFDSANLRQLAGARTDLETPGYAALKQRLRRLRSASPGVRFVYIFRHLPATGQVIFLGDSASPGAKDESLPGDVYPEAPNSPGLQEIIRTGTPATEGPLKDSFGTWVTGYVLIADAAAIVAGEARKEILGLDIDAEQWTSEIWAAGLRGAFYVWMLLGLPFAAVLVLRRQDAQRDVIRNLSEAMEQSHSAIMIADLEGHIDYVNRGLCDQLGYTPRELIGRKWRELHVTQQNEQVIADVATTIRGGGKWEGEWLNRRKDGTVLPVRGVITPVNDRRGALRCFVAVFDDATETKRREAELRDARDRAEAGDRAKGQFLATMSHEVRTPLNGIVGFTSLLLETPLSEEQREYVQTIKMSTEALIQLTGDILDVARIESGKFKLESLACDPRECVEDALDLLAQKAGEKGLDLLHSIADDVPAAVVTDGGRLRQVLVNLVGNAVKFTERGEVTVRVSLGENKESGIPPESPSRPASAEKVSPATTPAPVASTSAEASTAPVTLCTLVFTVQDTGIGIALEHQSRLFKSFSQVDETITRRHGGTGLGLAISRNLVHLMGGEISLVSERGHGSTFTFSIRVPVAAGPISSRNLGGVVIAVCALRDGLRRELTECLTHWGAQILNVSSPQELGALHWNNAIIEVNESLARDLASRSAPAEGMPPEKTFALIPISLPTELRNALRVHFRLLINKPLHHDALFAALASARVGGSRPPIPPPHFGFRVLVVEDNIVNQRLMQRMLTSLGCSYKVVGNGQLALDELTARAVDFDLVLLDLHMPEMDGVTALEQTRAGQAGPRAQTMWTIALTADARGDQRSRVMAAGANDYLTKPVALSELETALRRFRAERGSRR